VGSGGTASSYRDWNSAGVECVFTVRRFTLYPGYSITSMETETYRPARLILLGENASPQARRSVSLDALVTPQSPPFFLWHTAEDIYVPPEHTYRFAGALAAHGVPHAVHVFAHGPHSLGLAEGAGDTAAWTTLAASWIREYT
jgi:acetyl esterase/lipase